MPLRHRSSTSKTATRWPNCSTTRPKRSPTRSESQTACNVDFEFGTLRLPNFTAPDGLENFDYLHPALLSTGSRTDTTRSPTRTENGSTFELDTIKQMGYVDYFLIVWRFHQLCALAGDSGRPGPRQRGRRARLVLPRHYRHRSAANINLLFERFLNPERVSMPDIRHRLLLRAARRRLSTMLRAATATTMCRADRHVRHDEGARRRARRGAGAGICLLRTRTASRSSSPQMPGHDARVSALEISAQTCASLYEEDDACAAAHRHIDASIEGMPRHTSMHAAGVVITDEPV